MALLLSSSIPIIFKKYGWLKLHTNFSKFLIDGKIWVVVIKYSERYK